MAEPTEAEQVKQTQILEKVDKKSAQVHGELGKIAATLKETNALAILQHDESEVGKEEYQKLSEVLLEKQAKDLRSQTKIAEDEAKMQNVRDGKEEKKKDEVDKKTKDEKDGRKRRGEWFEKTGSWFTQLKSDADDDKFFERQKFKYEGGFFTRQLKSLKIIEMGAKEQGKHDDFMEGLAKEGNWFQRKAYNMSVRAAKLALRGGGKIVDWGVKGLTNMKNKAFDWIKSLGKLLALLGIWGAALWLDANMLKEDWEALKVTMKEWQVKLLAFWEGLKKFWKDATETWGKIQKWFKEKLGVDLELWHLALLAFGVWFIGFRLASSIAFWALRKSLTAFRLFLVAFKKTFAIAAFGARKTLSLMSWLIGTKAGSPMNKFWRKLLGLSDDVTDAGKGVDKASKAGRKLILKYDQFGNKIFSASDDIADAAKHLDDSKHMKPGFFKTLGEKITKMFSKTAGWFDNMLTNVTKYTTDMSGGKGSVWTNIKTTMTKMMTSVGDWFTKTKTSVSGWFSDKWKSVQNLGKTILGKGKDFFGNVLEKAKALGDKVGKIPGLKQIGKVSLGVARFVGKVITPIEMLRGAWAGGKSRGEDDERTTVERLQDAGAGAVRGFTDLWVGDTLELIDTIGSYGKDIIFNEEFGTNVTWAKNAKRLYDKKAKEWTGIEFTNKMFSQEAGWDPFALGTISTKKRKKMQSETRAAWEFDTKAFAKSGMGKFEQSTAGYGVEMGFDKEGFQKLLLATAGAKNFAMMDKMVTGLEKMGKLSAEDASRYKMDIIKEYQAGTPPSATQINNYTSHTGSTSMIMAAKTGNPEYITLTGY